MIRLVRRNVLNVKQRLCAQKLCQLSKNKGGGVQGVGNDSTVGYTNKAREKDSLSDMISIGDTIITPEKRVKQKVIEVLKKFKAYYFYPSMIGYGSSGVPDIVVCFKGRFVAIECKAGKNRPTALQQRNIDMIKKNGGIAIVVNESTIESVQNILNEIGESNAEI